jgi:hypothetical protein
MLKFWAVWAVGAAIAFAQDTAGWQPMFDGKSLAGWRESAFANHGAVRVQDEAIVLEAGRPMTGATWTGAFPKSNYELRFEAKRVQGNDFFASVTFPVAESFCTWVLGGWGGDIVGLSSIDGWDASDNETRSYVTFDNGRWYSMRLQVTDTRISAWIDDKRVIQADIEGRTISLRPGDTKLTAPFGFVSYGTTGAIRKIEYRLLRPPSVPASR